MHLDIVFYLEQDNVQYFLERSPTVYLHLSGR